MTIREQTKREKELESALGHAWEKYITSIRNAEHQYVIDTRNIMRSTNESTN